MTSDRAAKQREQRAQDMLRRVVGAAPDVIYVYHVPWRRIAFLGQRTREVLGFAAARSYRLRIDEFEQLVHPNDLGGFRECLAAVERARDGEILCHDMRVKGADARYRRLRIRHTVLARTKSGAVAKVVGIVTNLGTCLCESPPAHAGGSVGEPVAGAELGDILATIGACYIALDRNYRIIDVNSKAEAWMRIGRSEILGQSYLELIRTSDDHVQTVRDVIERGVHRTIETRSVSRPGAWLEMHIHPTKDGASVFFRDITERKRAEREAERSRMLLQSSLDALAAEIAILDESGIVVAANQAWKGQALREAGSGALSGIGVGSSYLAHCERALPAQESADLGTLLRLVLAGEKPSGRFTYSVEVEGEPRWRQISVARFEWDGDARLIVADEDLTEVRQAKEALSELSGRMSTLREEERQRIAQELHDSTAQHLVAATLNLMTLKARAMGYPGVNRLLESVEASLEEATRELRVFTYLLHPLALENDGLEPTLRTYLDGFARRTGLNAELTVAGPVEELPFSLQCSLLRIIQEALANVHRHARATRVSIGLKMTASVLRLVVSDDGRGLSGSEGRFEPQKGIGIPGMRSRLREFGGTLEILKGGTGTTLVATVPLPLRKLRPTELEREPSLAGALGNGSHRS